MRAMCIPIEMTPAMLKSNEKQRKYHFFPSQSTFTLRKSSTILIPSPVPELKCGGSLRPHIPTGDLITCRLGGQVRSTKSLNRQFLSSKLVVHMRIEDHTRDKDCCEQVGDETNY